MSQLLEPDAYADLALPDQFIEDMMQQKEAALILDRLSDCHSVLDLGWGSGIVARALHAAGKDVTVVEGSAKFCRIAAENGLNAVQCRFEDYAPTSPRDAVIASFVLEHVADPVALLRRARGWSKRLVVAVGNAESFHRRVAVKMGLQPRLDSLSARDHAVGHYRVYSLPELRSELVAAGWLPRRFTGLMFKPLNNAQLAKLPPLVIHGMCEMDIRAEDAANILVECV